MNIALKIKALVCGGGDLKSVTGETLLNAKWALVPAMAIMIIGGHNGESFFEIFVAMSLCVVCVRVIIEAVRMPYSESLSDSGLETNEQLHNKHRRLTHDFRMATSASALAIFCAYVIFLLYYGFSLWDGFSFWLNYVGS